MRRWAIALASLAAPLVAAAQPNVDIGGRIAGSAVAAQSLQGPLDGTWALTYSHARTLFVFQLVDPASGAGRLQAAWRRGETLGVADAVRRGPLSLTWEDAKGCSGFHRFAAFGWRGDLVRAGRRIAVSLVRRWRWPLQPFREARWSRKDRPDQGPE